MRTFDGRTLSSGIDLVRFVVCAHASKRALLRSGGEAPSRDLNHHCRGVLRGVWT
jgi:hypothetical protein